MKLLENKIINKLLRSYCWILLWNKKSRVQYKHRLISILAEKAIKKIEETYNNYWILLPRLSYGDLMISLSLLNEFKTKNAGKIVIITDSNLKKEFVECFDAVDETIVIDIMLKRYLDSLDLKNQKPEKGHIIRLFAPFWDGKSSNLYEDYLKYLKLDNTAKREKPVIRNKDNAAALTEFKKLELNQEKTVLLAPHSVTFNSKDLSVDFWLRIAENLMKNGYSVVFNTDNKIYRNYPNVFLPMNQMISFAGMCQASISFRSGFNDILAGCGIQNMFVIYPRDCGVSYIQVEEFAQILKQNYFWHDNIGNKENIFNIYSLNKIFDRNDVDEIIFDGDELKLINYLTDKIKNKKEA